MTPALLIKMSSGRPSAASSSPSAATLFSDDRSRCLMLSLAAGNSRRISVIAVSPLVLLANRHHDVSALQPPIFSPDRIPDRYWLRSRPRICRTDPVPPASDQASPGDGKLVDAVGQGVVFERELVERHRQPQRRDTAQQGGQNDL